MYYYFVEIKYIIYFILIFFLVLGSIPSVRNFSFAASSAYCQPTPEEVPYETKDIVMMWDKTCHIGIYFISVFWLPYLCKGKYKKSFPKVLCHPEVFSNNDINVTCFWTSALKYLEGYAKACNRHLITVQKKLFSKKKIKIASISWSLPILHDWLQN